MRAAGLATAVAVLSDWDFFFLGALSKLSKWFLEQLPAVHLQRFVFPVATSSTYPYMCVITTRSILTVATI